MTTPVRRALALLLTAALAATILGHQALAGPGPATPPTRATSPVPPKGGLSLPARLAPSAKLPRFHPPGPNLPPPVCDGVLDDFEGDFFWSGTGGLTSPIVATDPRVRDVNPPGFALADQSSIATAIGGDYWDTPFPNGHEGARWAAGAAAGTMTSPTFTLNDPYLHFLLGGGGGGTVVQLEAKYCHGTTLPPLAPCLPGQRDALCPPPPPPFGARDGDWTIIAAAAGAPAGFMRRVVWRLTATAPFLSAGSYLGCPARIVVTDAGVAPHVAVDSFVCSSAPPAPDVPMVWGLADLHTHPAADRGFGGMFFGDPLAAPATQVCKQGHGGKPLNANTQTCLLAAQAAAQGAAQGAIWGVGGILIFATGGLAGPFVATASGTTATAGVTAAIATLVATNNQYMILTEYNEPHRAPGIVPLPGGGTVPAHNGSGYPNFTTWPFHNTVIHQQMYLDQIKRAWQGGLRIMVADVVNNRLLSFLMGQEEDDLTAFNKELQGINDLVHAGAAFMAIAHTPAEARQIIGAGKLALVLGIELDEPQALLRDRYPQDLATSLSLSACFSRNINKLSNPSGTVAAHDLTSLLVQNGIRHVIPVHLADNPFGGTAVNEDLFNALNFFLNGSFLAVEPAPVEPWPIDVSLTNLATPFGTPRYPPGPPSGFGQVNVTGLTPAGAAWMIELRKAGLVVDVSHLSNKATNQVLTSGELRINARISPPIASHTGIRQQVLSPDPISGKHINSERGLSRDQVQAIYQQGGMIGLGVTPYAVASSCQGSVRSWIAGYLDVIARGQVVALATDMNGLNGMTRPLSFDPFPTEGTVTCREGPSVCYLPVRGCTPQQHPALVQSTLANRKFDMNTDGWAHYGMMADFLQQARNVAPNTPGVPYGVPPLSDRDLEPLFQSAEAFIRTWEADCAAAGQPAQTCQ